MLSAETTCVIAAGGSLLEEALVGTTIHPRTLYACVVFAAGYISRGRWKLEVPWTMLVCRARRELNIPTSKL